MRGRRSAFRYIGAGAVALVAAVAANGVTASNTVPDGKAGDGSNTISGFAVSNIDYVLDAADPSLLEKVTFDVDAAATEVYATVDGGTTWVTCTDAGAGTSWDCDPGTDPSVSGITSLQVVATDD